MEPGSDAREIRAILSLLGREIGLPLGDLRASLLNLLADPDHLPSATDRSHATTMLELCDNLQRLVHECLEGEAEPEAVQAPGGPA